jgi:Ran GTPase-activating protein (RanGAP) involved in mRNA processing and transport
LWSLSLRGNSFGPAGCEVVCEALKGCPVLRRVDVSQNQIGKQGGLMLVELLQFSGGLLELYLGDTEADIDVLVGFSTVMLTGVPQLKVCNLENPRLDTKQEDHTVHLGRMLRVNTSLSEIYLGKCKFRDEGVRQLVSFLMENKSLRALDLRCNEIGAEGACHLGTLLASDCQLSLLNLSSNRIGEKENVNGANALASALLSNRMLRALDLSNCMLCGQALLGIGEALEKNSTLETIALFHNQWDQPASFKFQKILGSRTRITPLRTDFVISQVDLNMDVCKVWDFELC